MQVKRRSSNIFDYFPLDRLSHLPLRSEPDPESGFNNATVLLPNDEGVGIALFGGLALEL